MASTSIHSSTRSLKLPEDPPSAARIISIGEVLWDVIGPVEHPGGAPFNFAAQAARLGHVVTFVSAVGMDDRGARLLQVMRERGVSTRYVRSVEGAPTGSVSVTLDNGQPRYAIQRPAAYDFPALTETEISELSASDPDWIYFGTLQQTSPIARALARKICDACPEARRLYDVNLRPDCYELELVMDLMASADVVKVNEDEARLIGPSHGSLEQFCRSSAERFELEGVCITRGEAGCAILLGGEYIEAAGYPVQVVDTVGAGDAFAAAFVHGIGHGWPLPKIAEFSNRVGAIVASRPGALPPWTPDEIIPSCWLWFGSVGRKGANSMASYPDSGIVTLRSNHSVDQTVEKIEETLKARGVKVFALVDHSGEAEKAGMSMPPTRLLIFGHPKSGTPLMLASPSVAIDLPLKILVSEDSDGQTWISYNSPSYLQARHNLPQELVQNIGVVAALAASAAE